MTSIGEGAFWDCENLVALHINKPVDSIPTIEFPGIAAPHLINWGAVNAIVYWNSNGAGEEASQLPSEAFGYHLTSNSDGYAVWSRLDYADSDMIIPDTYKELPVIHIRSFYGGANSLLSLTIPVSITYIGENAFSHCDTLTNITFNGTVSEWNAITKDSGWWNSNVPATYIQCTDGQVTL